MKRYLGIIVAVVCVIAAIVVVSNKYKAKAVEVDREASVARTKVDYLERVAWIRSNPDEKSYKEEVTTFFRWYFSQVNKHQNQFGGSKDFDEYLTELDKKGEKTGKGTPVEDKKRYYEYTKKVFDLMKGGTYAPMFTGTDKGIRLDVLPVTQVTNAGAQQIRYPVVVWGAQRELRDEGKVKKMVTSAAFNVTWKLTDEKNKLVAEVNAPGDPAMKVDWPERFISDFPPQMVLGHFDIDLLPAEGKNVEIIFNVSSRSQTGGEIASSFTWKLEVPAEWKLKAGESWKGAQESVRPADEIDPALAQKKK